MPHKKRINKKKTKNVQPCAIDLFSGCGGLTLGLKQAGFRVISAVESDDLAVKTYKHNHPKVNVWHKDIRRISSPQILKAHSLTRGSLDLLAGCPPCQGFSRMRRLNGRRRIRDKQNDLIFEFLRMVKGLRPRAVMMENVPGLAKNTRLRKLKSALKKLGYSVNVEIKDTSHYGVPQRRRRLILLAGLGKGIPFAVPARRIPTVRETFAKLSKKRAKYDALHNLPETRSKNVKQLIRLIPKNGGNRSDLGEEKQLDCHRNCNGFKDVYGRMSWNDVAPTITGGCCNPSKGRFLHPSRNRTVTLREAAMLQSFPVRYYFSLERGKFPAAQMIGNALPPEFIRRHALEIKKVVVELRSKQRKDEKKGRNRKTAP